MAADKSISSAVESLKLEQKQQRKRQRKGELEKGLEDTFPASDPLSATASTTATGGLTPTRPEEGPQGGALAERRSNALNEVAQTEKVDEALQAIASRDGDDPDAFAFEELTAMKAELARIKESIGEITAASGRIARTGAVALHENLEQEIRLRPWAAVGIAAVVGYVFGARR